MMKIIEKFNPLIKKYSRKLNYDGAETDLIITLIETILFLPTIKSPKLTEDKYIIRYIHFTIKNKYIYFSKKHMNTIKRETELNLNIISNRIYNNMENFFIIKDGLNKLTDLQKKVMIKKFFYGFTDTEIGKQLSISRQAVNRLKNRALERLRSFI